MARAGKVFSQKAFQFYACFSHGFYNVIEGGLISKGARESSPEINRRGDRLLETLE